MIAAVKQDASYFEGKEPILVFIARRLRDALKLETLFTNAGLEYGVEADHYSGGVIFRSQRVGAFFYVLPESAEVAYRVLQANGYQPYRSG